MIKIFGNDFSIQTDIVSKSEYLFCKACQTRVNCDQKSQVQQHVDTGLHIKSLRSYDRNQKTVVECFEKNKKDFNQDLCQFLVKMNVPFLRLLSEEFKKFFEKYTQYSVPSPQTLWNNNLNIIYDNCIEIIRN